MSRKYYVKVGALTGTTNKLGLQCISCNISYVSEKHKNIHVPFGTNPGTCTCFKLHGHNQDTTQGTSGGGATLRIPYATDTLASMSFSLRTDQSST